MSEALQGFDDLERTSSDEVRARLEPKIQAWHFQRRDGEVVGQLIAVADEVRDHFGERAKVVIFLGGSEHRFHHLMGSASLSLARHDRYPVVIVP